MTKQHTQTDWTDARRAHDGVGSGTHLLPLLALPVAAQAALAPPGVSTGAADSVSYGSATLTGSIDPRGSATSYYFQYGPTSAYGAQTPLAAAGAGTAPSRWPSPVGGLQPLTIYHYRLIAVNAVGAAAGAGRAFETAKVPLSLAILVAPNPVPYGAPPRSRARSRAPATPTRGRATGQPLPLHRGVRERRQPRADHLDGQLLLPVAGLTAGDAVPRRHDTNPPVVSPITIEGVAVGVRPTSGAPADATTRASTAP